MKPLVDTSPLPFSAEEARRALVRKRLREDGAARRTASTDIRPHASGEPAPLSDTQRGVWLLSQMAPDVPLFNECYTVDLPPDLDRAALAESMTRIVERHAIWRTTFDTSRGTPLQIVQAPQPFDLRTIDLTAWDPTVRRAEAQRLASVDAARPFDLARGPLVRALLVDLSDTEHKLFLTIHHIAVDGLTLYEVFLPELVSIYTAIVAGRHPVLPDLPMQYSDYSRWRDQEIRDERATASLSYWQDRLAYAPLDLKLPVDRQRTEPSFAGGRAQIVISGNLTKHLNAVARAEGATLFTVIVAVFVALLHRLTGQDDIVVGTPMTLPRPSGASRLIGLFANTVAIRIDVSGDPSFRTLVARAREAMVDALEHAEVPYDRVVEAVRPGLALGHAALFRAMVTLQHTPPPDAAAAGFGITPLEAESGGAKVDVALLLDERETVSAKGVRSRTLGATLQYNATLFDAATAARRLDEFRAMAESAVARPDRTLSELSFLAAADRRHIVGVWNATRAPYPRESSIATLFKAQVERTPDACALDSVEGRLTYRELDARSDRLASTLRDRGVRPGASVGLMLERSTAFVVGVLAILKAGASYVPLDPRAPRERLALVIADARPEVLLTDRRGLLDDQPSCHVPIVLVESEAVAPLASPLEDDPIAPAPEGVLSQPGGAAVACVLYTSGSTGEPKGVAITHRGIARLVLNTDYVSLREGDRVAHLANVCFDAASFEIWGALLSGATLVVIGAERTLSPAAFHDDIVSRRLTTMFLTTALFNHVARERPAAFAGMRNLLFGGEVADPVMVRRVLEYGPPERLLHVYGPTEATTFASWHLVRPGDADEGSVPIGTPIANTTLYVLDKQRRIAPVGVVGELFVGGDGVANGYLNSAELTAQRFVADPFSKDPGARLYRTGDLARLNEGGLIEFVGRLDDQIKLRGFRIEPREIESVLAQHPDVGESVVVAGTSGTGDMALIAFVRLNRQRTSAITPPDETAALRAFLKSRLPDYMVPASIVVRDSWPLTDSGKIDRRALAETKLTAAAGPSVEARDRFEADLVRLWEDLLNVSPIGVQDNFFDIGGHSLLAARMIDEVGRLLGRRIPLAPFFADPTIASIASAVSEDKAAATSTVVTLRNDGPKAPFFFVHGDFDGRGLYCRHLVHGVEADRPFHVIHPHGIDGETIPPSIEAMARERVRDIRRVHADGPFVVGGYCNGALVAFAAAQQLVEEGLPVERLILVDPPPVRAELARLHRRLAAVSRCLTGDPRRVLDWIEDAREARRLWRSGRREFVKSKFRQLLGLETPGEPGIPPGPTLDYALAIHLYAPPTYAGRVTLILSNDLHRGVVDAWRRVCRQLDVVTTDGSHQTCTTTYARALADRIRATLDAPEAGPA